MSQGMILKDLGAVLSYAKLRYQNEFKKQDIHLNNAFKNTFRSYLERKRCSIEYFDSTSVVTTKAGQNIFVANQWFAISSYLVDFCTELLTYQELFLRVCRSLHRDPETYAKKIRDQKNADDENRFIRGALAQFLVDYGETDQVAVAASFLWKFASEYSWWSGSKTIDRNDFYVSPVLNSLNIVNVSHGFVADIVLAFATDYRLRKMVDSLSLFTEGAEINKYVPAGEELVSYRAAEYQNAEYCVKERACEYISSVAPTISISLASLARFKKQG